MQKVKMIAQGRVQGVGFRWGVCSLALEIGGITGRVWNNDDGTVGILAQAESSSQMAPAYFATEISVFIFVFSYYTINSGACIY